MKGLRSDKLFFIGFFLIAFLIVLTISLASINARRSSPTPQQFVKDFYIDFYPKYVEYMNNHDRSLNNYKKLFERNNYFSDRLYSHLIDDERRKLAAEGEIAGLDFDPFTDAQDEVGLPLIGKTEQIKGKFFVYVGFSMCPNHLVIVELTTGKKGLIISNIIYPDEKMDLLKIFSTGRKIPR